MQGKVGDVDGQGLVQPQVRCGPEAQDHREHHHGHRDHGDDAHGHPAERGAFGILGLGARPRRRAGASRGARAVVVVVVAGVGGVGGVALPCGRAAPEPGAGVPVSVSTTDATDVGPPRPPRPPRSSPEGLRPRSGTPRSSPEGPHPWQAWYPAPRSEWRPSQSMDTVTNHGPPTYQAVTCPHNVPFLWQSASGLRTAVLESFRQFSAVTGSGATGKSDGGLL